MISQQWLISNNPHYHINMWKWTTDCWIELQENAEYNNMKGNQNWLKRKNVDTATDSPTGLPHEHEREGDNSGEKDKDGNEIVTLMGKKSFT